MSRTIITKSGQEWMQLDTATIFITVSEEEYQALLDGEKTPLSFSLRKDAKPAIVTVGETDTVLVSYTTEYQQYSDGYKKHPGGWD